MVTAKQASIMTVTSSDKCRGLMSLWSLKESVGCPLFGAKRSDRGVARSQFSSVH